MLIGNHERVIAPSELWLFAFDDYPTWRERKPAALQSVLHVLNRIDHQLPPDQLQALLAGKTSVEICTWLLSLLPPGRILVDKTPGYSNNLATLRRTLAFNPFVIWLVRHPLGVVESHLGLLANRHRSRRPGDLRWRAAAWFDALKPMPGAGRQRERKWVFQNSNIRTLLKLIPRERQACVAFEDVVTDPAQTLQTLCEAIGLTWHDGMLEQRYEPQVDGLGDSNFHLHTRIDPESAWRWKTRFDERHLEAATRALYHEIQSR
jgi:hypothetical protein